MSKAIYTREDLLDRLVALHMAGVQTLALRIFAASLGIEWVEVLAKAGRMIEVDDSKRRIE